MGKFLDKLNAGKEKVVDVSQRATNAVENKADQYANRSKSKNLGGRLKQKEVDSISDDIYDGYDDDLDETFNHFENDNYGDDYSVGIQKAQKPESFHHFILENQYKDIEKSIRGYKDVYNKKLREWEIKRKGRHCFTDDEAEDILRLAQSLLATDIKLSYINDQVFGIKAMSIFKRVKNLFREIAEYRYGRYSHDEEGEPVLGGYAIEQAMKLQNLKIFHELSERIVANYSRAIKGTENKLTHQSVSAQESLQSTDRISDGQREGVRL